jgi:hypothetical protein
MCAHVSQTVVRYFVYSSGMPLSQCESCVSFHLSTFTMRSFTLNFGPLTSDQAQPATNPAPAGAMSKRQKVSPKTGLSGDQILQRLLHSGGVSNEGLRSLLSTLAANVEGFDVPYGEKSLQTVFLSRCKELRTTIPLELSSGDHYEWTFLDPNKLLPFVVNECTAVQRIFHDAILRNPPSVRCPWSLIVGYDEFTPGSKFKLDNARKCMNLSFSFRELGQEVLCSEIAWFTPVCIQHKVMVSLKGGWSNALREYLKLHLGGPLGIQTVGVPLTIGGSVVMLYARLTNVLTDGDGFRIGYDWRASSSTKPCLRHWNVLKKDCCYVCALSAKT